MPKKYLTQEGLEKLKKELDHSVGVRRKEVSERLRHTASQGDLKENAGYDAAKEEQAFLEARIRELKAILAQAKVIEKKDNDTVQIGCCVVLKSTDGEDNFQIVGPEEADILNNKISFKSPLGCAILDKKKGEKVIVEIPAGKKEYKIIEIK